MTVCIWGVGTSSFGRQPDRLPAGSRHQTERKLISEIKKLWHERHGQQQTRFRLTPSSDRKDQHPSQRLHDRRGVLGDRVIGNVAGVGEPL